MFVCLSVCFFIPHTIYLHESVIMYTVHTQGITIPLLILKQLLYLSDNFAKKGPFTSGLVSQTIEAWLSPL